MLDHFTTLLRDDEGVTMVEYGLMLALVAVVAFVAVQFLGTQVSTLFNNIATDI